MSARSVGILALCGYAVSASFVTAAAGQESVGRERALPSSAKLPPLPLPHRWRIQSPNQARTWRRGQFPPRSVSSQRQRQPQRQPQPQQKSRSLQGGTTQVALVSDFESGTEEGWEFYAITGAGGGGMEVSSTNSAPPPFDAEGGGGGGVSSLIVALSSVNGTLGNWGGMLKVYVDASANPLNGGPIDITSADSFAFWLDPINVGSEYLLEVIMLDTSDNENFIYDCAVGAAGTCAVVGAGWQRVSLPLADFVADGSGDGILSGPVGGIDIGVNSLSAVDAAFYVDDIEFMGPEAAATTTEVATVAATATTMTTTEAPVPEAETTASSSVDPSADGGSATTEASIEPDDTSDTDSPVFSDDTTQAPIVIEQEPIEPDEATEESTTTTTTTTTEAPPVVQEEPIEPDAEEPAIEPEEPIVPDAPEPDTPEPEPEPEPEPTVTDPTEAVIEEEPVELEEPDGPITPANISSNATAVPTASPVAAPTPVVDDGRIECPKAFDEPCVDGSDLNCCLPSGKNGMGSHPLYRLDRGDKLQAGEWLCRAEYYFGLLHTGTLHTLRRDDDGRCSVLWTAEEGNAEGDFLEVTEKGNIGLFEVGGNGKPIWRAGCSSGKDSRIQMVVVREGKPDHRMVLLRSFKGGRRERRLGNNKRFNRRRKNNRRKKGGGGTRKRQERDWWVTVNGNEGARDC